MAPAPKISIEQLITHIRNVDKRAIQREEASLASALQTLHRLLQSAGSTPAWTLKPQGGSGGVGATTSVQRTSPNSAMAANASEPKVRTRRKARGGAWNAVEAALKKSGGTGTTASLKATWAKHGSTTPLGVALAAFVNTGRLKRKGKGRNTVYMLA